MHDRVEKAKAAIRTAVQAIEGKTEVFLRPDYLREELLTLAEAMDPLDEMQRGFWHRAEV